MNYITRNRDNIDTIVDIFYKTHTKESEFVVYNYHIICIFWGKCKIALFSVK